MAIFCLLCGGDSLESDISYVSYKKIKQELKYSNIATIDVYLNRFGEFYLIENNKLKKGQFIKHNEECFFKTKFKKYYFDAVLPIVHGKGVEDGSLGAYFDILKIPCMYSGITNASLLQNKSYFKKIIDFYDIPNVPYVDLSYYQYIDVNFDLEKHVSKLQFPLIVKPVNLGSSIGVKKVYDMESLLEALDKSFSYDSDVLIEKCVESLKEVNIALLGYKDNIIVSELETVSNKDDVYGIYSGLSLDVYFLLSTQIPQTIEIITNNETMNVRELKFKNRKVVLKKSRVKITKENENAYKIMEFFSKLDVNDFLKDNMCKREVVSFIKENKITYSNIYALAPYFPTKSIKNMVKCGVYDEIAQ